MKPQKLLSLIIAFIFFALACKKTETSKPKPTPDFSFSFISAGILPTTVQFTSKSENAETYFWNFGDGSASSERNPQHTYNIAKTYKIKLIVSNNIGKDSVTKEITVTLDKPKPDFNFTIRNNGYLPDTVEFVSTSKNATAFKWFLGDGDTSSQENPQKTYKVADTFNVKLSSLIY
jgi:PKD repeat protein